MRDNTKIIGNIRMYLGMGRIIWFDYDEHSLIAILNDYGSNDSDKEYYAYTYAFNDIDDNLPFDGEDSI